MNLNKDVVKELRRIYESSNDEQGGFITKSFNIVLCENIHPQKDNNYMMSCDDLDKLADDNVIATFHTHPNKTSNLSKEDYDAFLNWENLLHFIVGQSKINCYKVSERGTIVVEPIVETD